MFNKLKKRILSNERGAISIEFLGVLPFYFLFFLILWQAVSTGYAIMTTKTAVNEAAKYYAVTGDETEALSIISDVIGTTDFIQVSSKNISYNPSTESFEVSVSASHPLVFVPDKWKPSMPVPINVETTGRLFK